MTIVANCCSHILTPNDFKSIHNHLENLSNRLRSDDKKTIEHVCSIFSRLVENFHRDATILTSLASEELLKTMQTMIIAQASLINGQTFVSIIHMLYIFSAYSPTLAITLLKMNITETLVCLLTGSAEGKLLAKKSITYKSAALPTNEPINNLTSIQQANNVELIPRTPQELYEIVSLLGEMMPRLPVDDPLFQVDQLFRMGKGYDVSSSGHAIWHWQDDQGQLQPYSFQDSQSIEQAWQQHEEEIQLVISGRHYLLDLQQLQQVNEETNQARFIKRVINSDVTDPTSPSPSLSTEESSATSLPQTTPATVSNPIDPREELLRDNPELFNSFVQSLFTILYEVYNTSAGPAVKHRCLQSLLRMIYYSSSDLLETILKQQSISSHIASMLASSDYKIVISALQISEILMKKLSDIFSVYFYREGVVHQIEILIGFGITSTSSSLSRTHNPPASQSQIDLAHISENSSTPTISTLSESFDEQQIHSYSNDPPPTHRGAATQLHPKTQPNPYRGTTASRRHQTEPNPPKIETRSQRGRVLPPSSNSRIKSSTRSMFEEIASSTPPETSSIPVPRPRPTRGGTTAGFFRPTTFDPSPYYPLPTGARPRPSTPIYVPSPFAQQTSYAYASSAPAAASLMMSTSMPTSVFQQHQSHGTLSSQDKSKLKEWIQTQAQNFRTTYFSNNSSNSNIALQIINRLASAVETLHVGKDALDNTKALRDIGNIIAKGDVTPFEMVHSGLITKLFQYLTDDISIPNDRLERLKLFLNVFINIPNEDEKELKNFIIELHQLQLNNGKSNQNILSHLVSKLHGCINQLEQFPIRGKLILSLHLTFVCILVNDVAGRPAHSSALRLISTHQLKCNLVRHPQCKTLKQWTSGPVKIDPFALVSAIEKYLLLRGVASNTMVIIEIHRILSLCFVVFFCLKADPSEVIDDEESEVSNESDAEDVINVLAHSTTMRLEFLINDHVVPNTMTLYQAIRMYSTSTQRTA